MRLLETLAGLAAGFLVGGIAGLAVVGEVDSTGSHPTRNLAVVLLFGSAGALLAALAFVPGPAGTRDEAAERVDESLAPAPPEDPLPYSGHGHQS